MKVRSQAVSGLIWSYSGGAVRATLSLILGILLARILGPAPFGQVAICMVVIGIASLICDMGLGPALIQRKAIVAQDVRFVFTMQSFLGAGVSLAIALLASPIASVFGQPETAPVLRWLSVSFFMTLLGQTAQQLLQRDMRFKALQVSQILAYTLGMGVVGIPMALLGWGVWSLVAAQTTAATVGTFFVYALVRHPLLPALRPATAGLVGFGIMAFATNLLNAVVTNIDAVVVSRLFGEVGAGLYRRMQTLLAQPRDLMLTALQRVLFAAGSRLQDSQEQLGRALLTSSAALSVALFPGMLALVVVRESFVLALLGDKWMGAVPLVTPLIAAVCIHAFLAVIGPLLWATNRIKVELRAQVLVAAIYLAAGMSAGYLSLEGFAWAVAGIYLLRWILLAISAIRLSWITLDGYFRSIIPGLLAGLFSTALAWILVTVTLRIWDDTRPSLLLVPALLAAASVYATTFLLHRSCWPESLHEYAAAIKQRITSHTVFGHGPVSATPVSTEHVKELA